MANIKEIRHDRTIPPMGIKRDELKSWILPATAPYPVIAMIPDIIIVLSEMFILAL